MKFMLHVFAYYLMFQVSPKTTTTTHLNPNANVFHSKSPTTQPEPVVVATEWTEVDPQNNMVSIATPVSTEGLYQQQTKNNIDRLLNHLDFIVPNSIIISLRAPYLRICFFMVVIFVTGAHELWICFSPNAHWTYPDLTWTGTSETLWVPFYALSVPIIARLSCRGRQLNNE